MPKVELEDVLAAYAGVARMNNNFEEIEEALDRVLFRDGTAPNAMLANLDMNGFDIVNFGDNTVEAFRGPQGPAGDIEISGLTVFTPGTYGAVGDGVTNDYNAISLMVEAVNTAGGGHVILEKDKTYYIDEYETPTNGISPISFTDCNGLVIDGSGAKLDFKGDFDRDVSGTSGIGLQLTNCNKAIVRNLELDGNVEQTTNSGGLNEDNSAVGLNIRSCHDVLVANVHSHHFATDGIAFRSGGVEASPGVWRACQRITVLNSQFEYNSRIALSPIGVRGLVVDNCSMSYTARHAGTYGVGGSTGHAPKCAFDIEPTANLSRDGDQDVDTGNIFIRNSQFIDNLGGDLRANDSQISDTIVIENCRIISTEANSDILCINLNRPGCVVRGCYIDAKDNIVRLTNCLAASLHDGFVTHVFQDNEVRGYNTLMDLPSTTAKADISNNRFICTATTPLGITSEIINIGNAAACFDNNTVFMPKEAFATGGANDRHEAVTVGVSRQLLRNRFETDLPANQSGATTAHFYITFGAGADSTEVADAKFVGTAPGTADTFRPGPNSTYDTTYKFNRRRPGYLGVPGKQALTNAAFTYRHGREPMHLELAVALTANRTITLDTTDASEGAEAIIVRTAASTGAFSLNVGTGPLIGLQTGQWCRVRYSGAAWTLVSFGVLAESAAVADPAALTSVNATNAAGVPTQAEFNAFVAEFNKLRTDLGATRTQLIALITSLENGGVIA